MSLSNNYRPINPKDFLSHRNSPYLYSESNNNYSNNFNSIYLPSNPNQSIQKTESNEYNPILKEDKDCEILNYPITFACYLIQDLILISSKLKKYSVIYSANNLNTIYEINDFIELAFNLGNDKIIIIGNYIKEIIFLPDIEILSLNQYETDIFGSFKNKTFYPINDSTFLFINHKNRKLKEIVLNQNNELIIKNEILCPLDTLNFCPFSMNNYE